MLTNNFTRFKNGFFFNCGIFSTKSDPIDLMDPIDEEEEVCDAETIQSQAKTLKRTTRLRQILKGFPLSIIPP